MGERPLTDLGVQLLGTLPSVLRGSYDYQAVIHAGSREIALLEAAIEQVRAQFNPASADILLGAWEFELRLPVGGNGASLDQRREKVFWRIRKTLGSAEGRSWEDDVTRLVGSGWSYEEHIPGDSSSPPEDTLRIVLPFPPSGSAYKEALEQIREITPAHLEIEFESAAGFLFDASELDIQELTF